jgi:hypothetical protein
MSDDPRTERWWTPQQIELVEDRRRTWRRAKFEASDMLLISRDGGQGSIGRQLVPGEMPPADGEIVKGGWDHEHCELCWTKISAAGEGQRDGYVDGKTWLCADCFETYIAPRLTR